MQLRQALTLGNIVAGVYKARDVNQRPAARAGAHGLPDCVHLCNAEYESRPQPPKLMRMNFVRGAEPTKGLTQTELRPSRAAPKQLFWLMIFLEFS